MLQHLLLLAVATNGVIMAPTGFICPSSHITISSGVSGVVPAGATDSVPVAAGTNCTFYFDLPKGYALKVSYKGFYNPSQDDAVYFNNEFFLSPTMKNRTTGSEYDTEFAVGHTIPLAVTAITNQMTFIVKYSFVDMSHYTQQNFTTGQYFSTNIAKNTYFTIWASEGDHVAMSLSDRANSQFYDHQPENVFVYQASSCDFDFYVGRLDQIYRNFLYSDGQALTFVNLYEDETSNSIVLGNDWSKVKDFDEYHAIWVDPTKPETLYLGPPSSMYHNAAYTIICDNCDHFYVANMDFEAERTSSNGYISVQGMTPTDNQPTLITYQYTQWTNESLPQLIPARMATFYASNAHSKFVVTADQGWTTSYYGRNGFLAAPKSWDPMNEQKFDYTFKDGKGGRYNYRLSIDSVILGSGDKLTMTIGNGNGTPVFTKTLTSIDSKGLNYGATGEYLTVSYQGSKGNDLKMRFYDFMP